ncbi:MAG: helix-turn-helix domain-containing protein [Clostridia bacterium]|nr:helix-turn-helix domain-containing protein [Clostridia bacterium]
MEETQNLTEILTVKQVQENLHIGRNKAYEVFAREDFPALKIGRKFRCR